MKLKSVLFAMACATTFFAAAQFSMPDRAAELGALLDVLRAAPDDAAKQSANEAFRKELQKTLAEPTAFTYPFPELKTVGTIDSPDGQVRILSWNVEQDDQSQKYYAFILKRDDRKGIHKVHELKDNSEMLIGRTDEILEADNWYGALYYQIIPTERNNKTYYIVLGWDGNTMSSNIKLIDVLAFTGNNVRLGAPIFKLKDELRKRIYFEHSEKSVMSLRWDEPQQRILFDHLSPETANLEGFYEYYVPDMSYDALEQQGNRWVLLEDVIGLNKAPESIHLSHIDEKTGEVKEEDVDNTWIDPSKGGAPENIHVATMPDKGSGKTDLKSEKAGPTTALDTYNSKKHRRKEKAPAGTATAVGKKRKRWFF